MANVRRICPVNIRRKASARPAASATPFTAFAVSLPSRVEFPVFARAIISASLALGRADLTMMTFTDSEAHPLRYVPVDLRQSRPGDLAPWFRQRSITNPAYAFDTAAGRYIVLCFFGSAADPKAKAALNAIQANRALFDDVRARFFGVSVDPTDLSEERVREHLPGVRFFLDFDRTVSRRYGAVAREAPIIGPVTVRQFSLLLDRALRVVSAFPFTADEGDCTALLERVRQLLELARPVPGLTPTPVLWLPNVFEPELCSTLIDVYKKTREAKNRASCGTWPARQLWYTTLPTRSGGIASFRTPRS